MVVAPPRSSSPRPANHQPQDNNEQRRPDDNDCERQTTSTNVSSARQPLGELQPMAMAGRRPVALMTNLKAARPELRQQMACPGLGPLDVELHRRRRRPGDRMMDGPNEGAERASVAAGPPAGQPLGGRLVVALNELLRRQSRRPGLGPSRAPALRCRPDANGGDSDRAPSCSTMRQPWGPAAVGGPLSAQAFIERPPLGSPGAPAEVAGSSRPPPQPVAQLQSNQGIPSSGSANCWPARHEQPLRHGHPPISTNESQQIGTNDAVAASGGGARAAQSNGPGTMGPAAENATTTTPPSKRHQITCVRPRATQSPPSPSPSPSPPPPSSSCRPNAGSLEIIAPSARNGAGRRRHGNRHGSSSSSPAAGSSGSQVEDDCYSHASHCSRTSHGQPATTTMIDCRTGCCSSWRHSSRPLGANCPQNNAASAGLSVASLSDGTIDCQESERPGPGPSNTGMANEPRTLDTLCRARGTGAPVRSIHRRDGAPTGPHWRTHKWQAEPNWRLTGCKTRLRCGQGLLSRPRARLVPSNPRRIPSVAQLSPPVSLYCFVALLATINNTVSPSSLASSSSSSQLAGFRVQSGPAGQRLAAAGAPPSGASRAEKPQHRRHLDEDPLPLEMLANAGANHSASPPAKLKLWTALAGALGGETSGASPQAVERLALKLATWPDQRQAALFYVELVARSQGVALGCAASDAKPGRGSSNGPPAISLAELMASNELWAATERLVAGQLQPPLGDQVQQRAPPRAQLGGWQAKRRVALDELWPSSLSSDESDENNKEDQGRKWRLATWLNGKQRAGSEPAPAPASAMTRQLAELALENANLISRLLLLQSAASTGGQASNNANQMAPSDPLGGLATPSFFKYLLASKVRQVHHSGPAVGATGAPMPAGWALHSAGLVFLDRIESDTELGEPVGESSVGSKFMKWMSGDPQQPGPIRVARGPGAKANFKITFAPQAIWQPTRKQVDLIDSFGGSGGSSGSSRATLGTQGGSPDTENPDDKRRGGSDWPTPTPPTNASGSPANGVNNADDDAIIAWPSFLLKWLLSEELGQLERIKRRLWEAANWSSAPSASSADNAGQQESDPGAENNGPSSAGIQMELEDGRWFWPHLECDPTTTTPANEHSWMLTYSVPFFSQTSNGSWIQFRGISYVKLNLAKTSLANPCEPDEAKSFLANTHQCANRLTGSQCVALTNLNLDNRQGKRADSISAPEDNLIANPPAGPQLRLGAYACKCPAGPAQGQQQRPATRSGSHRHLASLAARRRENLAESILARTSGSTSPAYALDQLALEPLDARLLNKRLVGESLLKLEQSQAEGAPIKRAQLFRGHRLQGAEANNTLPFDGQANGAHLTEHHRTAHPGSRPGDAEAAAAAAASGRLDRPDGSSTATKQQYFALGAQLEADAILEWFAELDEGPQRQQQDASSSTGFPLDTCATCKQNSDANKMTLDGCKRPDDELDMLLPASSWLSLAHWIRPLVLALQLICICLTLVLITFTIRVRKSRIIIVSGWLMLETMLFGALLLYISVLVQYFQPTSLTCLLEPWFRELGFSIFYGSILIKLHKILTEFQTRKAHRVCFRDKDQIIYLLGIVFIVVIYMSAWTAQMIDRFYMEPPNLSSTHADTLLQQNNYNNMLADGSFEESLRQRLEVPVFHPLVAEPIDDKDGVPKSMDVAMDEGDKLLSRRSLIAVERLHQPDNHGSRNNYTDLASQGDAETRGLGRAHGPANNLQELSQGIDSSVGSLDELMQRQAASFAPSNRLTTRSLQESYSNDNLKRLARELDSLDKVFSGLLETERQYDPVSDLLVYSTRCRKLTWDYVTEMSEMALLLFGLHLVYKLRNASSEMHKEKLILSAAVFLELLVSSGTYLLRHALWHQLNQNHLLAIYSVRCQLTVSLTVALVLGPKFWKIGKGKPSSLFGAFASNSSSAISSSVGPGAAGTSTGPAGGGQRGKGSVRHRCHISCEIHDHHLNDATRLHQAMLSNSALEIGSINLADMDPDEIQAELKRVYTQLEVLKTKVMRRDNPHISKRRGGRKPGHRKFSLQAFHARHSSGGAADHHHHQQQQHHHQAQQNHANNQDPMNHSSGVKLLARGSSAGELMGSSQHATAGTGPGTAVPLGSAHRLPAVAEIDGESPPPQAPLQSKSSSGKHVRVEDPSSTSSHRPEEGAGAAAAAFHQHHNQNHHRHCSWLLNKGKHHRQNNQQSSSKRQANLKGKQARHNDSGPLKGNLKSKQPDECASEPASTSSFCLDDDALIIANDSQSSSGDMSPRGVSSVVCSQSSIHPDEPSNN